MQSGFEISAPKAAEPSPKYPGVATVPAIVDVMYCWADATPQIGATPLNAARLMIRPDIIRELVIVGTFINLYGAAT